MASVQSEDWLETELEDPEDCVKELIRRREIGLRADVFTFAQKPPSTIRRYAYPMDPDSIARRLRLAALRNGGKASRKKLARTSEEPKSAE